MKRMLVVVLTVACLALGLGAGGAAAADLSFATAVTTVAQSTDVGLPPNPILPPSPVIPVDLAIHGGAVATVAVCDNFAPTEPCEVATGD